MASISSSPCTVKEIFKDYTARRTALLRALTYGHYHLSSLSLSLSPQNPNFFYCFKMLILIEAFLVLFLSWLYQMWMNSIRYAIQVSFFLFNFLFGCQEIGENEKL